MLLAACGPGGPRSGLSASGPNGANAKTSRRGGLDPTLMDAPSVGGTLFVGAGADCSMSVYRFDAGGALFVEHDGGAHDDGSWKQTGAYLWAAIPARQIEFQGVVDGDRLSGLWTDTDSGTTASWLGARRGSAAEARPTGYACTTWRGVIGGQDWSEDVVLYFRGDSVLHWQDLLGYHESGTWTLQDGGVRLSIGAVSYRGELDGDRLAGRAEHGKEWWAWDVVLDGPPRPADVELAGSSFVGRRSGDGATMTIEFLARGELRLSRGARDYVGSWEIDGTLLHVTAQNPLHELELWGGLHDGALSGNGSSPDEIDADGQRSWFTWDAAAQGTLVAPSAPDVATVEGTTWDGELGDQSVVLRFEKDGRLAVEPAGKQAFVAVWQQSGDTILLSIAAWGWSYQGVVGDDRIEGHGWNDRGDKSALRLSRR